MIYRPILRIGALAALAFLLTLSGCASTKSLDPEARDPIEPFNRAMWDVNMKLDRHVMMPVAMVYRRTLPPWSQSAIRNSLDNLNSPVVFGNDLLQGEFKRAGITFGRFLINTVFGPVGFRDVAKTDFGVEGHDEDFGQTLGVWGVKDGFYLVLPLLGPSSPRDFTGFVADIFMDPFYYVSFDGKIWVNLGRNVIDIVDQRARGMDTQMELRRTSLDFYATVRSFYRQNRESAIRNGNIEDEELPQF